MELMKIMDCFTRITDARLKDCFIDDNSMLHFIVEENDIGKAIGRNGSRAKMVENILNRKIKIVEFNSDVLQFIKNTVFPLRIRGIENNSGEIVIDASDLKTRGLLIGRSAANLRNLELIVKRYFDIKVIKVN